MLYDPESHQRHSTRLENYDYAQEGAYFVTICTHQRECLLGQVVDTEMVLSDYGNLVQEGWLQSAAIRRELELDAFVVMPNHIHSVVALVPVTPPVGAHAVRPLRHGGHPLQRKPRSLGAFIAGFKSATTRRINELRDTPGALVWQRNYYDHIIRSERTLEYVRDYIATNPLRWHLDRENPGCTGVDDKDEGLFGG